MCWKVNITLTHTQPKALRLVLDEVFFLIYKTVTSQQPSGQIHL